MEITCLLANQNCGNMCCCPVSGMSYLTVAREELKGKQQLSLGYSFDEKRGNTLTSKNNSIFDRVHTSGYLVFLLLRVKKDWQKTTEMCCGWFWAAHKGIELFTSCAGLRLTPQYSHMTARFTLLNVNFSPGPSNKLLKSRYSIACGQCWDVIFHGCAI